MRLHKRKFCFLYINCFAIQGYYLSSAGCPGPNKVVDSPLMSAAVIGQPAFTSSVSGHTERKYMPFMYLSNCHAHSRSLSYVQDKGEGSLLHIRSNSSSVLTYHVKFFKVSSGHHDHQECVAPHLFLQTHF